MKKHSTPKLSMYLKTNLNLQPKQSTLDFIMKYAAVYDSPKGFNMKMPGMILN